MSFNVTILVLLINSNINKKIKSLPKSHTGWCHRWYHNLVLNKEHFPSYLITLLIKNNVWHWFIWHINALGVSKCKYLRLYENGTVFTTSGACQERAWGFGGVGVRMQAKQRRCCQLGFGWWAPGWTNPTTSRVNRPTGPPFYAEPGSPFLGNKRVTQAWGKGRPFLKATFQYFTISPQYNPPTTTT